MNSFIKAFSKPYTGNPTGWVGAVFMDGLCCLWKNSNISKNKSRAERRLADAHCLDWQGETGGQGEFNSWVVLKSCVKKIRNFREIFFVVFFGFLELAVPSPVPSPTKTTLCCVVHPCTQHKWVSPHSGIVWDNLSWIKGHCCADDFLSCTLINVIGMKEHGSWFKPYAEFRFCMCFQHYWFSANLSFSPYNWSLLHRQDVIKII